MHLKRHLHWGKKSILTPTECASCWEAWKWQTCFGAAFLQAGQDDWSVLSKRQMGPCTVNFQAKISFLQGEPNRKSIEGVQSLHLTSAAHCQPMLHCKVLSWPLFCDQVLVLLKNGTIQCDFLDIFFTFCVSQLKCANDAYDPSLSHYSMLSPEMT